MNIDVIPDAHPYPEKVIQSDLTNMMISFEEKEKWNNAGMYAFVSMDWVVPFAGWIGTRKVLEVMSGAGWLAKALREQEIDIIATDDYSWKHKKQWNNVTYVEQLAAGMAIMQYPRDLLIISWPYMDDIAARSIELWNSVNPGKHIVYIGEGMGGCTADDEFFEHFEVLEDSSFEKVQNKYQTWYGLHDRILFGRYKL